MHMNKIIWKILGDLCVCVCGVCVCVCVYVCVVCVCVRHALGRYLPRASLASNTLLLCHYVGGSRCWLLSAGSAPHLSDTPARGVEEWLAMHQAHLHPDSANQVRQIAMSRGQAPPISRHPACCGPPEQSLQTIGFSAATLATYSRLQPADWLQVHVRTQRHLPKRCHHLIAATLAQVHEQAFSESVSDAERSLYLLLFLLAPRWLWPEQSLEHGLPLKAHARLRLIHACEELWSTGQHAALLAFALAHGASSTALLSSCPRTWHHG